MPRYVALACTALLLCACSTDKGFGETKEVTADDYGAEWPLTVDTAKLNKVCGEGDTAVALIVGGKTYVINFDGPSDAPSDFLPLWTEDLSVDSGRKDLSPLVEVAESLCD